MSQDPSNDRSDDPSGDPSADPSADAGADPGADPGAEVRRALAELARDDHSLTMPDHVAARLDHVVADLAADRSRRTPAGEVDAGRATRARRTSAHPGPHRRRWAHVLVAAAAVIVVVTAGGAVLDRRASSDNTAAGSSASKQGTQDRQAAAPQRSPTSSAGGRSMAPSGATQPRLRTVTLAQDVQRVADDPPTPAPARNPDCARPSVPSGAVVVAVRLDGRAATLVLPPAGATGEAWVYSCDQAARPVATTSVLAP